MSSNGTILYTRDLTKHFGGLKAVEDVNLEINAGSLHSIIGPNGAGKTTLFNLLSGTLTPTKGAIFLRDQEITGAPPDRMAHLGMGRSYQITNLFPSLSVFENVRIAAQALGGDNFRLFHLAARFSQYDDRAHDALVRTGLHAAASTLAQNLPHGDQRRLELAILLVQDLDVWLLDEPTAGLASEQVPQFMSLIDEVRRESSKTVVLVEHNMNVVMSLSDRISVMHQGRILAEGSPKQIASNEVVRNAYLGRLYE